MLCVALCVSSLETPLWGAVCEPTRNAVCAAVCEPIRNTVCDTVFESIRNAVCGTVSELTGTLCVVLCVRIIQPERFSTESAKTQLFYKYSIMEAE